MNRKYLDDIGVTDRPDTWAFNDGREEKWALQRKEYGFDSRETWNLNYSWHLWLYERLKMFVDITIIDLDFHKFKFKEKEYTQREMRDLMLERLKFSFSEEYDDWDEEQVKYVCEIEEIWAMVCPAMWW